MEKTAHSINEPFRSLDDFSVSDLEFVRLILRGGTVLDWHRLNLNRDEAEALLRVHRIDLDDPDDRAMVERIRDEAVAYLREGFDFPVPGPVRKASLIELLEMAADMSNRHRQLCACMLLKSMHTINHFDASEARQAIKLSDQELFRSAERRIYQVVSRMMGEKLPVVEFLGGRKRRTSMVTKLLSKQDPLSAQLFDKMRFRVVTPSRNDILPTINFLSRNLFPFNYVLAGESYNTLLPFVTFCREHEHLAQLVDQLQLDAEIEDQLQPMSNVHSSPQYRVVHWVADMPLKLPNYREVFQTDGINPVPRPVIYVRAEIQILDRRSHRKNERGDAAHRLYKERQASFVADRLKVGLQRQASNQDSGAAAGGADDTNG
jgi:uncharacterized protein (TIGR04552 family)